MKLCFTVYRDFLQLSSGLCNKIIPWWNGNGDVGIEGDAVAAHWWNRRRGDGVGGRGGGVGGRSGGVGGWGWWSGSALVELKGGCRTLPYIVAVQSSAS
ncbi:MAG: hypothetical protein PF689_04525 [Deltaproteobacteria bacterium]|nr:hypothetical protein [Deltaproteobacteria bacterium]